MKTIYSLLFISCILATATFCYAEEEIEPKSVDHYRTEGVTIVLSPQWKPFSYENDSGERTGFLLDLWEKWTEKTGIPTRFVFLEQAEALESMKNGEADIHGGLYYSYENAEILDYADAVHSTSSVLAIRNAGPVDCANALSEGTVGIVSDAYFEQLFNGKYPESKKVVYPDTKGAIAAFLGEEVDAIAIGYTPLAVTSRDRGVLNELNICRTLIYQDVLTGVQKDQVELFELVNDGLSEITSEELKQIKGRWFAEEEQPEPQWKMAVLPAVAVLVLVVGIVAFGVRRRS